MEPMANLIHFIHRFPPAPGGAEFVAQQVCARMLESGHRVRVETTNAFAPGAFHQLFSETLQAGSTCLDGIWVRRHRCHRLPFQRFLLGITQRLAPSALKPWLNWYSPICPGLGSGPWTGDFIPEAVVVWALPHGSVWASALRFAKKLRVPLVAVPLLHPGNPRDPECPIRAAFRKPWIRQILGQADRVIALTFWEKNELSNLGVPPLSIAVAGLGLPPTDVTGGNRSLFRQGLGISSDAKVIGHMATLSKDKGTLDLLEARWRVGSSEGPTLVLAGERTPLVDRQLKKMGKAPWLRVTSHLSLEQKKDFYAGIDLFCLPSFVDSWSLCIMEAWSVGKGVIVYDAGGPGELIRHGVDGWKVAPGDIGELASVLKRVQSDADFDLQWGEAGMSRISAEFDWNRAMTRLSNAILNPIQPGQASD